MKLPKDMLQLAEHILETKAGDFEPESFEDRYENAVVEMIQRKRAGMPVPTEAHCCPRSECCQPNGRSKAQPRD
jgi:DNA end-binding protein Ku